MNRMNDFRAELHDLPQLLQLRPMWQNMKLYGEDHMSSYELSGLASDLEGLNAILNTVMRIAGVYITS